MLDKRPDEVFRVRARTLKGIPRLSGAARRSDQITSAWTKISPDNAAKVHELIYPAGALAPDGLLDRETMESSINEAREASGIKRGVKPDEIFDFRLTQRVNDELQGWKP